MMISGIVIMTLLGLALGALLGVAAHHLRVETDDSPAATLAARLPGSDCGQCGRPGCQAAAKAIQAGQARLSDCPQLDATTRQALAQMLAERLGLDPDPPAGFEEPPLATIDATTCIGCTKCLRYCGTDAIVGARRMVHRVFAEACTGCGRCVPVCPVGAIGLRANPPTLETWFWPRPEHG